MVTSYPKKTSRLDTSQQKQPSGPGNRITTELQIDEALGQQVTASFCLVTRWVCPVLLGQRAQPALHVHELYLHQSLWIVLPHLYLRP